MVIYNGDDEWTIPLSFAEATEADPAFQPYMINFQYSLVDLGRIPDANLSQERILRVGLLILKHGPLDQATRKKLLMIAREALNLGYDDLVTLIYYLLGDTDSPKAGVVRAVLNELLPKEVDRMISLAAKQWKTEGKAEGKAEMLLRLFRRRFSLFPEVEARILVADSAMLDDWADRFVDAKVLSDIFPDLPH
jgi:hypothetical protein